jgi:hypothetical protein
MLLSACLLAWPAMAQQTSNEVWPEVDASVKLGENSRLFLLTSGTRIREQGYSDGSFGVHLDVFTSPIFKKRMERTVRRADVARNKFLQVRIGYLYSRATKGSSNRFSEHTPTFELSPRFYLVNQILLTNRVRADLRFVNGVFTPRFRDRVKVERNFQLPRTSLTPYVHAEVFYDRRYDVWHRFRYSAALNGS